MKIKSKKSHSLPEINTTSLPDIIFMLLFFFMVVTVMRKDDKEKSIKIPTVNYAELIAENDIVSVSVVSKKDDIIYGMNREQYLELSDLENALSEQLMASGPSRVKLVADRNIPMTEINRVKTTLQSQQFFEIDYLVIQR